LSGPTDDGRGVRTARRSYHEEDHLTDQQHDTGEEESVYDFISERSLPSSDGEDDEVPLSDL
jgi:hypothetical protein